MLQNNIQWQKFNYENLLARDWSVSLHVRNLQILAMEMFNVHRDLSPPISNFSIREHLTMNYHISHNLQLQELKSVYNGSESIACLGLNISNTVPSELMAMSSISSFKKVIKEWYPSNCSSSLCKTYYLYESVFRSWSDI